MTVKSFTTFLLSNNGWKSAGVSALLCLGLLILLNSFLFDLAIFLLKMGFMVGALFFTAQTIWLAYPLLEQEYKKVKTS